MPIPISVSANLTKSTHTSTPSMSSTINVNVAAGNTDSTKESASRSSQQEREQSIPDALPSQTESFDNFTAYPSVPYEPSAPSSSTHPYPLYSLRESITINPDDENRFKDKYIELLINVINSPKKVLKSCIEPSKMIILPADELSILIALLSGVNDVEIIIEEQAVSCLGKVKFIKDISRILVGGLDLQIKYNHIYNRLLGYHVSLVHTFLNNSKEK
ncbi:uncharacterized protein MONOS_1527 [Monocercomonoides exilis]|uniref:uncharacterized protein n=1 Tax=Monocercomonoides exilis TaxID=2049356 RepID=UPI00355A087F|nr:hypothetical protein MONOS_1527 [Monocercomonoides exilis]|eukprot:MONOS_1527.1-p1 / transcript=MONOS_1527.1 / gene=MONOS_1527 / organism=Monocercomonoides_exilis_PA203 / gene_product=unspecified product / transcript_product=unspecified product / location=Mono_scaffold00027:80151-80801(-) / protein_length=217 / sequence_SO=supercontig / SO=protein_coding / is_pseudo=false